MAKVLISPSPLHKVDGRYSEALRAAGFELVYHGKGRQLTEAELIEQLAGIKAVVAGSEPYTPRVFAAHPQLRVVARVGVGYDAIDLDAATAARAVVTFAPGTNQDAVAEHAFCLILALTKNLIAQHQGVKEGRWPRGTNLPVRGRTLGIAGMGRIGKAVALRGLAFGMRVLAYEPFPDKAFVAAHGIELMTMDRLFAESDFLSLHLPMSPESKHMINKKTLALMNPTAFLINTARGGLVCEADLVEALRDRKIAGAGLDVFEEEPPPMSPLFALDNVVFTPHAAGVDLRSRDDMAFAAAEAIVDLSQGKWPVEKVVNPAVRADFCW